MYREKMMAMFEELSIQINFELIKFACLVIVVCQIYYANIASFYYSYISWSLLAHKYKKRAEE